MSHPRTWITRSIALVALLSLLSTSLATASPRSSAINPVAGPDDPSREAVGDPDTGGSGRTYQPVFDLTALRLTIGSLHLELLWVANSVLLVPQGASGARLAAAPASKGARRLKVNPQ